MVIGDVGLGLDSSVWFGCVVRGDVHRIVVGAETNLQDLTVVHVTGGLHATSIGDRVTVGHRAILHGCTVHNRCLIGMGAVVLDGAVVGTGAIVAAGALVPPGGSIPPGTLAVGAPARVVRPVTAAEDASIDESAAKYVELARRHAAMTAASGGGSDHE
ncbi:MAG: gamma carbonic anhydrase family protein [Deltaproteobacteria bacterium]|nr:gamma carbonic anhydrase family protein [Deltaproteobacteria bacterium]